ncbi:MAG: thioredoxin family protein [Candidatus Ancaeobacter aquaticus]|nr:thioredoxin family protein [Candidatus Ancaeobacter aquaticus]
MKIEIFGPGCPKCEEFARIVQEALDALNCPDTLEKVKDMGKIVDAGVLMTPGLSINGTLKCTGRVPKLEEVKKWIEEAQNT